jgi:ApaG protein
MATPEWSETSTQGIRVKAGAFYRAQESNPEDNKFVFGYRITIHNEGDQPAKLLSRHWVIIDSEGHREDVRGPGVIGQTPTLEPGNDFEYTSFCPLRTDWGTMEGSYQMQRPDGSNFDVAIGRFYLRLRATDLSPAS